MITAAELLAEIGDRRDRYRASSALEAIAGQSPVAVESGKTKVARFRWACDKRLRDAVCVLADSSRQHNPWARKIYEDARARGHDHPHAIRILGRAWCASSGACGRTTSPTTPPATAASSDSRPLRG